MQRLLLSHDFTDLTCPDIVFEVDTKLLNPVVKVFDRKIATQTS